MTPTFEWLMIGDIDEGRPTLGDLTTVTAYRLALFAINAALINEFGEEQAKRIFYQAGQDAGREVYRQRFADVKGVHRLVQGIADVFNELKLGVFRIEDVDAESGRFEFSVLEDLDCSGTPDVGATKCPFDEGLIAGILGSHLAKSVHVRETECWGAGGKMCRFEALVGV